MPSLVRDWTTWVTDLVRLQRVRDTDTGKDKWKEKQRQRVEDRERHGERAGEREREREKRAPMPTLTSSWSRMAFSCSSFLAQ